MASKSRQRNGVRKAFEDTASNIARLIKGVDENSLHRISMLGSIRLVVLRNLQNLGYSDPSSLMKTWDAAKNMGCPLLAPSLDDVGSDPVAVVESCLVPQDITEPGALVERLGDLALCRDGKSGRYKTTLGRKSRRRKGAFFTPDWMADRLVNMAMESALREKSEDQILSLRIADPACGDGRLLTTCLGRMLDAIVVDGVERIEISRLIVERCLHGVELDPIFAAMARTSLWLCCDPASGPINGLDTVIVTGDSILGAVDTRVKPGVGWTKSFPEVFNRSLPGFDVIVANPPFEVLTGFAKRKGLKSYTGKIRKSGYELAISGSLNTYRLFLERSFDLLADDARLAVVLPFGFMMDRSASKLRSYILRKGWLQDVEIYPESSKSFEGVGQSVVLLAARKKDGLRKSVSMKDGAGNKDLGSISLEQLELLDSRDMVLPATGSAGVSLAARMASVNTSNVGELAFGMVGELDQTKFRQCMVSRKTGTLLVRGMHMSPYAVNLGDADSRHRWVDMERFESERASGRWRNDIKEPRLVQTGIVNMEAARRLVAARVPRGVVLGNSVNYWMPRKKSLLDAEQLGWYLLAYLNSTPAEWRFRLTSSNNNINLYEVRALPLPRLTRAFASDRIESYLDGVMEQITSQTIHPLGMVRQITAGWGAPSRTDRVVALLMGSVAKLLQHIGIPAQRARWLEHLLDHLVNWHLGLDEPDLSFMLEKVPARAWSQNG